MKLIYILFILSSFFIVSCSDGEKTYDYKNTGRTEGLNVSPSILKLTAEVPSGYFSLNYSPKDLIFIMVDNSTITEDFSLDKTFTADRCAKEIEINGECRIYVYYEPKSTGTHEMKLTLKFLYSEDINGEQAKDHILNITGVNAEPVPVPPVPEVVP